MPATMQTQQNYVDGPASVEVFGVRGGTASGGPIANRLLASKMDVNVLRPWIGRDGNAYQAKCFGINQETGKPIYKAVPIGSNVSATLLYDEWKLIDTTVRGVAKPRMRAFSDLRAAASLVIPNGMGKTLLQFSMTGDITPATISMSPLRQSERDRPETDYGFLPLPIISKDFWYDIREIEESRNGRMPIDTRTATLATRRVSEEAEMLLIGVSSSFSYGGGTVYGYTNFPQRNVGVITAPTAVGWTPAKLVDELLAGFQMLADHGFYGPFRVYFSNGWNQYLGKDYKDLGDATLRTRVMDLDTGDGRLIAGIDTLDYLTGFQIVIIQMTEDVARAIVGMDIQTVQWDTDGGFRVNFKVLAMLVPQLWHDLNGNCGIWHGAAA